MTLPSSTQHAWMAMCHTRLPSTRALQMIQPLFIALIFKINQRLLRLLPSDRSKTKAVSDLVLGYNDGSFGLMLGTPRGLFVGTGSKQPNLCEVHLTTTPGRSPRCSRYTTSAYRR